MVVSLYHVYYDWFIALCDVVPLASKVQATEWCVDVIRGFIGFIFWMNRRNDVTHFYSGYAESILGLSVQFSPDPGPNERVRYQTVINQRCRKAKLGNYLPTGWTRNCSWLPINSHGIWLCVATAMHQMAHFHMKNADTVEWLRSYFFPSINARSGPSGEIMMRTNATAGVS